MRNQRGQRSFQIALAVVALLVTVAPPASASHDDDVYDLMLSVRDQNGEEREVISLDKAVQLPHGESVILQMFTEVDGHRRYLPTQFNVARGSGTWLNHHRNRREEGQVTIDLHPNVTPTGPVYLEYELFDSVRLSNERMRRGAIRVDVVDRYEHPEQVYAGTDDLVTALYRGILMRDPDPTGFRSAEQTIRDGGWDAILLVARNTATSRESQVDIHQRGVSNQERLTALYRELQGRDSRYVDSMVWRDQLDRLGRGDVAGVVLEIVNTPEFQQRFGLTSTIYRQR